MVVVGFFVMVNVAKAKPPRNMNLSYDLQSQMLHVEVEHVCDNRNNEYIHKVTISINRGVPEKKYYGKQRDHLMFIQDIAVTAKVGDVIKVAVYAKEGGFLEGSLVVAE